MPKIMQSYEMLPDRFKERYFEFYKELYNPDTGALDMRTKELISLAASLVAGCQGCFKGHIKKAARFGATREEIGEAIAIAIAINAAAIVDQTDIANFEEHLVESLWGEAVNDGKGADAEDITP